MSREEYKDAIEVSVIFHEGQRMFAVPKQPAQQEPDAIGCKCSECGAWQRWTPSGMVCKNGHGGVPGINHRLYTFQQPAQRTWQGLTDKETEHLWEISRAAMPRYHTFKTLIEKALRERNT